MQVRSVAVQRWKFLAGATVIVLVAFLARIYRIGEQELWYDEAQSFYIISWSKWPGTLLSNDTPPMYYFLLLGWVKVFGYSETALRMLSASFGTLFVVALIWVGCELFNPRVGLCSAMFVAVSPFHIYYSQEARSYALLILALLLTYGALWRALAANLWRWWGLFCAGVVASSYTHYFATLGLIPTVFLLLLWPEREQAKQKTVRYVLAMSLSGLLILPWFLWSVVFTSHPLVGTDFIQSLWNNTPPLLAIPRSLELFGLGSQAGIVATINAKRFGALMFPAWLHFWGIAVLLLLGIWVAVSRGEEELSIPWLGRRKTWLWTVLFFPLVCLWLISFFIKPFYAVGRYEIVAFPAYSLLLGLSLAKVKSLKKVGKPLAFLVFLILFIPIGSKLYLYYRAPSSTWASSTAKAIHTMVRNGDVVVFTGEALPVFYYLSRLGYEWRDGECVNGSAARRFSCRMFPREGEQNPSPYNPTRVLNSMEAVRDDLKEFLRLLHPETNDLWIVFTDSSLSEHRLKLPKPDSFLAKELLRLGRKPVPMLVEVAPGVFTFQGVFLFK